MFARYHGYDLVKGGTYLCLTTGEFSSIAKEGGRLGGPDNVRFVKVNPVVALLVGPIVGMLFVIFLPLAVPLFIAWLLARKLGLRAPGLLRQMAAAVRQQSALPALAAGLGELPGTKPAANGDRAVFEQAVEETQRRDV